MKVLKNRNIYEGNFWWTTARWLKSRAPLVGDLDWSPRNRYAAEEYIMKFEQGESKRRHYCVHHAHHNMHVPTPSYEFVFIVVDISAFLTTCLSTAQNFLMMQIHSYSWFFVFPVGLRNAQAPLWKRITRISRKCRVLPKLSWAGQQDQGSCILVSP